MLSFPCQIEDEDLSGCVVLLVWLIFAMGSECKRAVAQGENAKEERPGYLSPTTQIKHVGPKRVGRQMVNEASILQPFRISSAITKIVSRSVAYSAGTSQMK